MKLVAKKFIVPVLNDFQFLFLIEEAQDSKNSFMNIRNTSISGNSVLCGRFLKNKSMKVCEGFKARWFFDDN